MSWYGRLKLAMPFIPHEEDEYGFDSNYSAIGHGQTDDALKREMLWIITNEWDLEVGPPGMVHYQLWDTDGELDDEGDGFIARGRYEQSERYPEGRASCLFSETVQKMGLMGQRAVKSRVEKMLENEYEGVEIVDYTGNT